MAASAKALIALPTPSEVEAVCIEYNRLSEDVVDAIAEREIAEKDLLPVKNKCIDLVRRFGSAHGKKSKLLHGLLWEIMCTFGSSTSSDGRAIETLRLHLESVGKTRLLKKLFESTPRWTLKETARVEIQKPGVDDEIKALFALCDVTKNAAPGLDVRLKKVNN